MRYAKIPNGKKPRRVTRFDYGGTTSIEEENALGKTYQYDEYGNLMSHDPMRNDNEVGKASSQSTTDLAVGAVTAYNPIIGGISGGLQSIGRAEREKHEAKDEYGRYKDTHSVGTGAVAGGLTDPLSGALEDFKTGDTWRGIYGFIDPVTSAFTRGKEREKEAKKHNEEIDKALAEQQHIKDLERSKQILANYPTHGLAGAKVYAAFGGDLNNDTLGSKGIANRESSIFADGGTLVPVASDSYLIKGDTHNQDTNNDGKTGVTIQDKRGNDMAELENDEVTVGDKVFSTRLGYNVPALALAKVRGKAEQQKASNSTHTRQTGIRNLEKNDIDVNYLYQDQENFKKVNGIGQPTAGSHGIVNTPTAAYGGTVPKYMYGNPGKLNAKTGKFNDYSTTSTYKGSNNYWDTAGDIVANSSRYIDNYYNANIKRPKIPAPEMQEATPLETTVNVNPQLDAVKNQYDANSRDLTQNTSSSNVENAMKGSMFANVIKQRNDILANKANTEIGLRNAKAMNEQAIKNANIGTKNQYAMLNMERTANIQDEKSANVAQAAGDATQQIKDNRDSNLDQRKMELIVKAYSMDNDAASYQARDVIKNLKPGTPDYEHYKALARKNPAHVKAWNEDHKEQIVYTP